MIVAYPPGVKVGRLEDGMLGSDRCAEPENAPGIPSAECGLAHHWKERVMHGDSGERPHQ